MPIASPPAISAAVLDTNAVLDWLVFRHPACSSWTNLFARRSVRWLASKAMRDELADVLGRGVLAHWQPDLPAIWTAWDRLATMVEATPLAGPATRIRCTDRDDQKFVDLALGWEAHWLVSRDRAVLKLARRTRPLGLEVLAPQAWNARLSGG